jgi:hypothetical protein
MAFTRCGGQVANTSLIGLSLELCQWCEVKDHMWRGFRLLESMGGSLQGGKSVFISATSHSAQQHVSLKKKPGKGKERVPLSFFLL